MKGETPWKVSPVLFIARARIRESGGPAVSIEAVEHFKAWSRDYCDRGLQPTLTAGDQFVGISLAFKALPRFDHTYRGGFAKLAEEFAIAESTVRYHCQRLVAVGGIEIHERGGGN